MTDKMIATTILNQLGGHVFIAFTGSSKFGVIKNGIKFNIRKNKTRANWMSITLTPADTYKVTFTKVTLPKIKKNGEFQEYKEVTIKEFDDIYCDQLQELFTEVAGLYTHF